MTDIAALGIQVDSSDLQSGSAALNAFVASAEKAEGSVVDFESASKKANSAVQSSSTAIKETQKQSEGLSSTLSDLQKSEAKWAAVVAEGEAATRRARAALEELTASAEEYSEVKRRLLEYEVSSSEKSTDEDRKFLQHFRDKIKALEETKKAVNDNAAAEVAGADDAAAALTRKAGASRAAALATRGGVVGIIAMGAAVGVLAGVTKAINDTTDANVEMGDVAMAVGGIIGDAATSAFEPFKPAAKKAWDFVKSATATGTNKVIRDILSLWQIVGGAFEVGGVVIVGGLKALWDGFLDGIEVAINLQLPILNTFIAAYNKIASLVDLPKIDLINPVDFNKGNENEKKVSEKVAEILEEREKALRKIANTDYAAAAFDAVSGRAIQIAMERADKQAAAEAKRRQSAKERAMQALEARQERFIQSRMQAEGDVVGLIQRRLQIEYDALDELGAKAIKNGADAVEINNKVAEAKREAMRSANLEIHNYEEKLRKEREANEKKALEDKQRDAKRRAAEEARTKDRIKNFDRALNRDGIMPGKNLDQSPFGESAKKFGSSRELGRQSPQSQISEILSQQESMMAELDQLEAERLDQVGNNRDAQLDIERDFAERRAEIQEEMLDRQKDVMAQAADLALGDAENLFGSLADAAASAFGKQSAAARAFLIAEQGIMIARASMALGPALMNALAAPFPMNLAQFATVAALGAQIIGNISNISTAVKGRRQGGYVGGGMMYEVNEGGLPEVFETGGKRYLMPGSDGNVVPDSRLPRAGNDNGSRRPINIQMIDKAGVKMTARQMSDDEIELRIEQRATDIVDKKVPKIVSGQISRGNSPISQSMTKNTKTQRKLI